MPRLVHLITFFYLFFVASLNAELIFPPEINTPQLKLYYATCENDPEAIEQVVHLNGVDINKCVDRGFNALHYAIYCGNEEAFHKLLELGADVNAFVNNASVNPLGLAIITGSDEMFNKLMDLGADPSAINEKRSFRFDAFAYAAIYGRDTIFRALLAKGLNPDKQYSAREYGFRDDTHYSPIALAARNGHLSIIRLLIEEYNVPIETNSVDSRLNPLYMAAYKGQNEVVAYLIEHGARLSYAKYNSLRGAVINGRIDTVKLLLQNGATDIDNDNGESKSANWADRNGCAEILNMLEAHGMHSNLEQRYLPENQPTADATGSIVSDAQHSLAQELLEGDWTLPQQLTHGDALKVAVVSVSPENLLQNTEALLTAELSTNTDFKVLERTQLQSIIDELKLGQSGQVSGQHLAQLSQLTGADVLIILNSLDGVKQPVVSAKIIDAHLGLVLGVRYFDASPEALEISVKEMTEFTQTQSGRVTNPEANSFAVSLVNIRANLNTPITRQTERIAKQVLELQLAQDHRLVLLQREQIDQLTREAGLRKAPRQDLLASSVFIDGRIDVDDTGNIEKLTIRLQRPNSSDEDSFELAATNASLSQLMHQASLEIVRRLTTENSNKATKTELTADAEHYIKEAKWLREVGLPKQALEAIRTAIRFGHNTRAGWVLYHRIINDYAKTIHNRQYSEAELLIRIELEKERLYALSGILRFYLSDATDSNFKLHWSERGMELGSYKQFSNTINKYSAVSLRRVFAEEFKELEELFLALVKNDVCELLESSDPRALNALNDSYFIKWLANSLTGCIAVRELDFELEVMPVVDQLIQSFAKGCESGALSTFATYLRFDFDDNDALLDVRSARILRSIQQYGSPMLQWAYCDEWLDERRPNLPLDLRLKLENIKTEQWLAMSDIDRGRMLKTDSSGNPRYFDYVGGKVPPFTGYVTLGDEKYQSLERERIFLAYGKALNVTLRPDRFQNPKMLQEAKKLYQAFIIEERNKQGKPDYGQQRLDEYNDRLALFKGTTPTINIGELPMRMWHPSLYGYPEFHHNESFKTKPVFWKDKWLILGVRTLNADGEKLERSYLQNPDYYLFEIDPETLETKATKFKSEHLGVRYWSVTALESGLLLYNASFDKRREENPIVFLDFNSLKSKVFRDYIPVGQGDAQIFSYDDSVYFLCTPKDNYEKRWSADHPPSIVMMIQLNPVTGETKVIYNSRRNPPENILDSPPGRHYFFSFFPEQGYLLAGESKRGMINLNTGAVTKRDDQLLKNRSFSVKPDFTTTLKFDGRGYFQRQFKKHDILKLPANTFTLQLTDRIGGPNKRALKPVVSCQESDTHLYQKIQDLIQQEDFHLNNPYVRQAKEWGYLFGSLPRSTRFPDAQRVYFFFSHADFAKAMSESDNL